MFCKRRWSSKFCKLHCFPVKFAYFEELLFWRTSANDCFRCFSLFIGTHLLPNNSIFFLLKLAMSLTCVVKHIWNNRADSLLSNLLSQIFPCYWYKSSCFFSQKNASWTMVVVISTFSELATKSTMLHQFMSFWCLYYNKDFFSKRDQIRSKLPIWSYLLKKYLLENFICCVIFDY